MSLPHAHGSLNSSVTFMSKNYTILDGRLDAGYKTRHAHFWIFDPRKWDVDDENKRFKNYLIENFDDTNPDKDQRYSSVWHRVLSPEPLKMESTKYTMKFPVCGVPVKVEGWVAGELGVDIEASGEATGELGLTQSDVCPNAKASATIIFKPYANIDGLATCGVDLIFAEVMIKGQLALIHQSLPLNAHVELKANRPFEADDISLKATVDLDYVLTALQGKLSVYGRFLNKSGEEEITHWGGLRYRHDLFDTKYEISLASVKRLID